MEWFNYPGLELWKFINLAIFMAAAIYVLRRKINEALLARGESIKKELLAAQQEREQALAQSAEVDSLVGRLDQEVRTVHEQARREAEAERKRLAASTDREVEKVKQQAQRDMEAANKFARKQLREYLAKRSVEHARESVRNQLRPEDDANLIKENISSLRRTTA